MTPKAGIHFSLSESRHVMSIVRAPSFLDVERMALFRVSDDGDYLGPFDRDEESDNVP